MATNVLLFLSILYILGAGASKNPCSETYRGSRALSEVEMQNITDYALARKEEQEFIVFIDWHSYSQLFLAPWSYSEEADPPKDETDLVCTKYIIIVYKVCRGFQTCVQRDNLVRQTQMDRKWGNRNVFS